MPQHWISTRLIEFHKGWVSHVVAHRTWHRGHFFDVFFSCESDIASCNSRSCLCRRQSVVSFDGLQIHKMCCSALTVPAQPCRRFCCRATAHQAPSTVPLGPYTASLDGKPRDRAYRKPARSSRIGQSDLRHLLQVLVPRSVDSTRGQPSRPESFATSAAPTYSTHSKS